MALIIVPLVILALIAAIWGQKAAQGVFHAIALPISLVVIVAVGMAWPPGALIGLGIAGFVYYCRWAEKASKEKAARDAQRASLQQSQKMTQGIAGMKSMLNVLNQASAGIQNAPCPPPVAASKAPVQPPSQTSSTTYAPPVQAPPMASSPPPAAPRVGHYCTNCGSPFAGGQRFCGSCGRPL